MTTPTAAYDALRPPLPGVTPDDWARMSWHQRETYRRNLWRHLEATERPQPRPVTPDILGPYSLLSDAETERAKHSINAELRVLVHVLCRALDDYSDYGTLPHGARAARKRHEEAGEPPCAQCRPTLVRKVTDADETAFAELRRRGWSYRRIGAHLGYEHSTVRKHLNRPSHREKAAA